jgi:hypothetical protein
MGILSSSPLFRFSSWNLEHQVIAWHGMIHTKYPHHGHLFSLPFNLLLGGCTFPPTVVSKDEWAMQKHVAQSIVGVDNVFDIGPIMVDLLEQLNHRTMFMTKQFQFAVVF